jgi:hypothetical protein
MRTPHLLGARALIHRKRRLTAASRAMQFGDVQRDHCFRPADHGALRTGIGHKHRSFGSVPQIALPIDQTRSAISCESAYHSAVNFLS